GATSELQPVHRTVITAHVPRPVHTASVPFAARLTYVGTRERGMPSPGAFGPLVCALQQTFQHREVARHRRLDVPRRQRADQPHHGRWRLELAVAREQTPTR